MGSLSAKKMLLLGFVVILLLAIPLLVYLTQKQQEVRSRAEKSTVLSFSPPSSSTSPLSKKVGDSFDLDVVIDPGKNVVAFVKLIITYDPTVIATSSAGACGANLCPNQTSFGAPIAGPDYSQDATSGKNTITANFSVGTDPTKYIQSPSRIATISFKALSPTSTSPTQIAFDTQNILVLSTASSDQKSENVFSSASPAFITVASGSGPNATPTIGLNPTQTQGQGTNLSPVCSSLNIDRAASGSAPFSLTFAVIGTDTDGTIQQVTFNYGDGPVENILSGGGIGTKTLSLQKSHTYNNPGTYSASAILTDNNGATSLVTNCTQTVSVTQNVGGAGGASGGTSGTGGTDLGGGGAGSQPPGGNPPSTPVPTSVPPLKPGPADTLLKAGVLGGILSLIGAALFLAL